MINDAVNVFKEGMEGSGSYKHSAPLEPGRGRGLWMLLFDVRVFREAGSSVVPHATRKLVHSAIRH